jgi:hypothetical protein
MKKICRKCGAEKDEIPENFRPQYNAKTLRHDCRECERKERKIAYDKNPEKEAAASRKWARDHKEHHNATKRNWVKNNPEKHNAIRRKSQYGVTDAQYQEIFKLQDGKCAICGFQFPGQNTGDRTLSPHVDHCHKSGKVRGLLCNDCNRGLGAFKDSQAFLEAASYYLSILG